MTDGLIFLWFSWILWIIVTFFMRKGRKRTYFACVLLLLICGSNMTWEIGEYKVTFSFLILFVSLVFFHTIAQSLYLLFSAFTLCLAYTGILFWEQITPIWMFLPRMILIPLVLVTIISVLIKSFEHKLAIGLFGITFGEIYHSVVLVRYTIREPIGDTAFFDMLMTFLMLLTVLEILHKGKTVLYAFAQTFSRPTVKKHKVHKTLNG
ncbi:hypothetical protein ABRT01_00685 [Lentibacillus sp. L22]|uniref:YphA family membrane protein n=1 Tax=Lentibacillus sp. L22 TaxID=3163028 RepID=UPI003465DE91